jgi:hypothetical protein
MSAQINFVNLKIDFIVNLQHHKLKKFHSGFITPQKKNSNKIVCV